jgi:hypothetical protein
VTDCESGILFHYYFILFEIINMCLLFARFLNWYSQDHVEQSIGSVITAFESEHNERLSSKDVKKLIKLVKLDLS